MTGQSFRTAGRMAAGLLLTAVLGGCDVTVTDPDDGFLGFDTILRTQFSDVGSVRLLIVTSPGEWSRVWDDIGGAGAPPSVNFLREMVIVVAAGSRPNGCYEVEITSIEHRRGRLEVEADLIAPGAGCVCNPVITRPLHAVATRRVISPAELDLAEVVVSCG